MVVVLGYLGYGNYGDELLAKLVSDALPPESKIHYLSSSKSFFEHIKALLASKILIAVGGLFQDRSSILSVIYYSLVILFAKLCGLRIIMLSQGIGPLRSFLAKSLTAMAFGVADKVSVRDRESAKFLQDHGIDCLLAPDLAWTVVPKEDNRCRTNIIFAFRLSDLDLIDINKVRETLSQYPPEKYNLIFVNMQTEDEQANQIIFDKLQLEYKIVSYDIDQAFASSIILMGTRFHALVLGKIYGLKIVDPKDLSSATNEQYLESSFGQKISEVFLWLNLHSMEDLTTMSESQLKFLPLTL